MRYTSGCRRERIIWLSLGLGLALVWTAWSAQEPLKATAPAHTAVAREQPAAAADARQSQEEAASLKREAVEVTRQVAAEYPDDPLSYALLGSAYYNTGRSEEAVKHLQKCLELSPNLAEPYEILARVAYEKGQLDEAVRLCQEALKRGPANPVVLNRLGRALMDQGRTVEAIQVFQQAVRLPSPVSESSYLLGQANLQAGNYAQAKESFQRAITLLPDHTQAYFGLYTVCMRLGQSEEAAKYREQFQKLETTDRRSFADRSAQEDTLTGLPMVRDTVARTLFGAGQIYQSHQQASKAAPLIGKAASLDAENGFYRAALEAHYVQSKQLAEGVAAFEQLSSEQPTNQLNYVFLGRLRARLGQIDAAAAAFRKVQELAPGWSEGYRALAELYLQANREPGQATTLAKRTVELTPTGPHYYLLARACLRNNDRAGALDAIQRAIALAPGEQRYRQMLEQLNRAP